MQSLTAILLSKIATAFTLYTRICSNFLPIELKIVVVFFKFQGFLLHYLDKIIVKFLSNAISIGIFLSWDIVVLGNMRASKLHCSAILPKNIARVNQPLLAAESGQIKKFANMDY